ncbi:MAG: Cytidylyltransferase family protein [Methanomassiliicoccales archaeon PtaU1.Bin124]|nr:MAG: Cytidylyltransferase family protein [Methanomassiliicoccales archaeon PtaU1.Bin124]
MVDGDVLGLLITYTYVIVMVFVASKWELLKKYNMHRKFIHIMIGNIVIWWWVFQSNWVMSLLTAVPFIPVLFMLTREATRKDEPQSKLDAEVRRSFLAQASINGHKLGLVYYAISWALLAFFAFDNLMLASIGIVCMAYGDGMGGLIGKRYGKRKIHHGKTLEGTMAVFTFALAASIFVFFYYDLLFTSGIYGTHHLAVIWVLPVSLFVAAYVAVVELYTPGEYDNLVIPLSTVAILWVLGVGG